MFSVSRVHIHSCATTLDKRGRSSQGGGGRDGRCHGWLAEGCDRGEGSGKVQTSTSTELQTQRRTYGGDERIKLGSNIFKEKLKRRS